MEKFVFKLWVGGSEALGMHNIVKKLSFLEFSSTQKEHEGCPMLAIFRMLYILYLFFYHTHFCNVLNSITVALLEAVIVFLLNNIKL